MSEIGKDIPLNWDVTIAPSIPVVTDDLPPGIKQSLWAAQDTDYPIWHWHRLGRQCRGITGRGVYRYLANEPDFAG
jgi:hypothetical protein